MKKTIVILMTTLIFISQPIKAEEINIDPQMKKLQAELAEAEKPLALPPEVVRLRRALGLSKKHLANKRIIAAQDLTWALINTPAFLFNR